MAARRSRSTPAISAGTDDHRGFLIEVAWLHHEFGLTQETIADRMAVSRSTISRALSEAERLGIVQVVLTEPLPGPARLADELRERFGVPAHVGAGLAGDPALPVAARAAARVIERTASAGGVVIAASWGRTLAAAVREVRPRRTADVTVVDAVGHASGGALAPAVEVTARLADTLGGRAVHMPSPAFADSRGSLEFLLSSAPVRQALDLARSADLTLVSVGIVGDASLLRGSGFVSPATMKQAMAMGAVGEILGWYYDATGRAVRTVDLLPVGLSLADLRQSRRVVAVAAGAEKATALRGALAGDFLDEIVVDASLGAALLTADEGSHTSGASTRESRTA